jgi:dimethylargininase
MRALVRPTSRKLADGQLTHIERVPVDVDLAEQQWGAYCDALDTWGFETVRVAGDDDLPDSVFVEDAVVMFGELAVITSPGAETRRPETDAVRATLEGLGTEVVAIELPGTLDGGDVMKVESTVYVGQGGRTNGDGIRQLRALLTPRGYTVVGVPVTKVLHLKSAVTALPDGTVIGHPDDVDHPGIFPRFLAMPEHGAAAVVLSGDTVLMAASVPESAALVESLGYRVITVDISEFEKLEGCVTCLSVRLRD